MLLDIMLDAEKQAGGALLPVVPRQFTTADEEVIARLIDRLRDQVLSEMTCQIPG
jgi:hypothetical protein